MRSSHDHPHGHDAPGDGDDLAWLRRQVDDIFGDRTFYPDYYYRADTPGPDRSPETDRAPGPNPRAGWASRPSVARVTVIVTVLAFLVLVVACALTAAW